MMKLSLKRLFQDKNSLIFIWHSFFLALTMAMLDFNTVFPSLVSQLTTSRVVFGLLYSLMLGVPLVFNVIFSHYLQHYLYKKKILLLGIYLRGTAFLGMAGFTYYYAGEKPGLVIISFFFWIFLFSLSGGFAGLSYTDIIGKLFPRGKRGRIYAAKQFSGSLAALLGGVVITGLFSRGHLQFPANYSLALLIGFSGLLIASIAFWFIKEPPSPVASHRREKLGLFLKRVPELLKKDNRFSRFILVENITSFSLMVLPFYMVFARETSSLPGSYIGRYFLFQTSGTILSNLFWGYISNRLGSRTVIRLCVLLGGLIPLVAIMIAPLGPDYFVVVFILIGFVISGRRIGFDPYLLDIAPEEERTVYLGVRGTMSIMVVFMPLLGGLFIELAGYYVTFITVTVVMLTLFAVMGKRIQ